MPARPPRLAAMLRAVAVEPSDQRVSDTAGGTGRQPVGEIARGSARAARLRPGLALLGLCAGLVTGGYGAGETVAPSEALFRYLNRGQGDPAEVTRFIAQGADVNYRDEQYHITPLHNTLHYKLDETSKLLISRGADVNARNNEGNTPLYVAVHQELMAMTVLLVEKGADVNARNDHGYSPLRQACCWGNLDAIRFLLSKGAEVNAKDNKGDTPLHIATDEGNAALVQVLLDHKAGVNATGSFGNTPLHIATAKGHTAIVKLLLAAGADPAIRNVRDQTPMDMALLPFLDGNKEILELLKNAGNGAR